MQIIAERVVLDHPPFQAALDRWFHLKENGQQTADAFLSWDDPLAAYCIVTTIKTQPLSIIYSTVGETIEQLYGAPMKGKNLDDLYDDWFRKRAYEGYQRAMHDRCPIYERRSIATIIHKLGYHKLHLPFGEEAITQVVTYIMPFDTVLKRRSQWQDIINRTPWFKQHA